MITRNYGYYAFILTLESTMFAIDAGLEVKGRFIMRGIVEMYILRRRGTRSRRI
jgi:hypothetical protein